MTERLFDPANFMKLSNITRKSKQLPIVAVDTEDNSKGTVVAYGLYDGGLHFKDGFYYTRHYEDCIKAIIEYPHTAIFVAHNLDYDIANIYKHDEYLWLDEIIRSGKMLKVTLRGTKSYWLNSLAFFPGSLKEMGKVVGIEKLEQKPDSAFDTEYLKTDCKIAFTYVDKFQRDLAVNYNVSLSPSIASISMNVFRSLYLPGPVASYNGKEMLKAYYGGRVEIFYRGVINEPVYVSDINSCYPFVMRENEFPDSETLEPARIDTHDFGLGHFKVYVPEDTFIPILPAKYEGKLFFPVGTFEGWWTYPEIRACQKEIPGFKVLAEYDGIGTHFGVRPFAQFINDFYGKRKPCKLTLLKYETIKKDGAYYDAKFSDTLYKLIMNSLYGKFAQNKPREILSSRPVPKHRVDSLNNPNEIPDRIGPLYMHRETEGTPASTANYIWSIYVTAYARLELYRHLKAVYDAGATLIYCDTDSVMFFGNIDKVKKTGDYGSELGQLDKLDKFDWGLFRQSKGYMMYREKPDGKPEWKVACKGVRTDFAFDYLVNGLAKYDKPTRFMEALRARNASTYGEKDLTDQQNLAVNVWHQVEKRMHSEYIKRKGRRGKTFPVSYSEVPDLCDNCYLLVTDSWIDELKSAGVIYALQPKQEAFTIEKVPANWFNTTKAEKKAMEAYEAQAQLFLNKTEAGDKLDDEEIWFQGRVIDIVQDGGKAGHILLALRFFMGEPVPSKTLKAILPLYYFQSLNACQEALGGTIITATKFDEDIFKIAVAKDGRELDIKGMIKEKEKEKLKKFLTGKTIKANLRNRKG